MYLKANAAAARGDVTETHRLSSKARSLVIASFALGIIITGIVVTYRLLLARRYYQWVLIETVMDLHLFKTMWNTFIYDNLHGSVMNIFKLRIRVFPSHSMFCRDFADFNFDSSTTTKCSLINSFCSKLVKCVFS